MTKPIKYKRRSEKIFNALTDQYKQFLQQNPEYDLLCFEYVLDCIKFKFFKVHPDDENECEECWHGNFIINDRPHFECVLRKSNLKLNDYINYHILCRGNDDYAMGIYELNQEEAFSIFKKLEEKDMYGELNKAFLKQIGFKVI